MRLEQTGSAQNGPDERRRPHSRGAGHLIGAAMVFGCLLVLFAMRVIEGWAVPGALLGASIISVIAMLLDAARAHLRSSRWSPLLWAVAVLWAMAALNGGLHNSLHAALWLTASSWLLFCLYWVALELWSPSVRLVDQGTRHRP